MSEKLDREDREQIKSWLNEARRLPSKDYFKKLIFYWISFNCYYGKIYVNPWTGKKDTPSGESEKIRRVLNHLKGGFGERESELFLNDNQRFIDEMITHMSPDYYGGQINKFQTYFGDKHFKAACVELIILIEKVRNRLFHGAKTYNQHYYGNREVLPSCCILLDNFMTKLGFQLNHDEEHLKKTKNEKVE